MAAKLYDHEKLYAAKRDAGPDLYDALELSRCYFVELRQLIEKMTGHDSIMAQTAIEKIDTALSLARGETPPQDMGEAMGWEEEMGI